ncbi:MAG: endo-1,4-beta-xylanase [Treponema sp.]|nr:endo-1,4-beta-xylanase [Treponema sp.]
MNKLSRLFSGILLSAAIIFSACTPNVTVKPSATVTKIDGSKTNEWNFVTINLGEYNEQTIAIDFSTDMLVENNNEAKQNLMWQVSTGSDYPVIAAKEFEKGTSDWEKVSGTKDVTIESADAYFYLNAGGIDYTDLTIYLDNFSLVITAADGNTKTYKASDLNANNGVLSQVDKKKVGASDWLADKVPSLYETYKDQFDSIGIAAEYGNFGIKAVTSNKYGDYTADGYWGTPGELYYEEIQKGIAKHANSITLGNELKPQFLLQWWDGSIGSATLVDFTASNGKTIKVPSKLNGENLIYATLNVCKKMNVQMRGHVLTWHSQTPDGFFAENYTPTYNGELISNMVDKETMTARHEWYIKTVLKCVDDWEKANGYRAIWAWDVVNEAMADDAGKTYTGTSQNWLRGSTEGTKNKSPDNGGGSRWYQVYGNEEFIVNAFRFANAYAPEEVKLCYNDYNEYWDADGHYKTSAIEHIAQLVKTGEAKTVNGKSVAPRLDVIAMQSHVGTSWPGVNGYESALKRFLAIADIHVSELDFSAETQAAATEAYKDYFTMLQKYGKKSSGTHKITNVTIWGINNESSWINPSAPGGKKTYPLLFNLVNNVDVNKKDVTYNTGAAVLPQYDIGDTYEPNDAFWAVINAHK